MRLKYDNFSCFKFLELSLSIFLEIVTRKHREKMLRIKGQKRFIFHFFFSTNKWNCILQTCFQCFMHIASCIFLSAKFNVAFLLFWILHEAQRKPISLHIMATFYFLPPTLCLLLTTTKSVSQSVTVFDADSFSWKIIFHLRQRNWTHHWLRFTTIHYRQH